MSRSDMRRTRSGLTCPGICLSGRARMCSRPFPGIGRADNPQSRGRIPGEATATTLQQQRGQNCCPKSMMPDENRCSQLLCRERRETRKRACQRPAPPPLLLPPNSSRVPLVVDLRACRESGVDDRKRHHLKKSEMEVKREVGKSDGMCGVRDDACGAMSKFVD